MAILVIGGTGFIGRRFIRRLAVPVREVGGEDESVVTDRIDDVLDRFLVAFDRHEALPLEVLAGRHPELRGRTRRLQRTGCAGR